MENKLEALRFITKKIIEHLEKHPSTKGHEVVFQAFVSNALDKRDTKLTKAANDVILYYKQEHIFKPKALQEILNFLEFKATIGQWSTGCYVSVEAANQATGDLLLDNWREARLNDGN